MSYNKKIIRTNSTLEIWEYEKIINSKNPSVEKDESTKERKKKRDFDELSDEEQQERLKRISKTRKNSRWEVMRLVDTNFSDRTSFLTLTTKENIQDRNTFNLLFDKFIKRLNYKIYKTKKRLLKYLAVLEKQQRGAWHVHIILFDIPFIPHKELLKLWGLGGVWINKIKELDSVENCGRYVSKYMEKGIGQELLESYGKKAYYSSRNLKKPDVIKITSSDELEDIVDIDKILYETEYTGKVFRDGKLIDNKVKYTKIKLRRTDDD
ncbi:Rep protein [Streptococcus uberis]|uniref:rolling circle replication-associated protein n=1 Tax=Streptococcus uberis TaxID=1349 RepID=UPI000C2D2605|nr:Rep protein [Streptococcus uberis]AUC24416.1 Rep protein [Streptococcus uberis]